MAHQSITHTVRVALRPTLALALATLAAAPASAPAEPMHLPARELRCHLGHATNLDATREQSRDEIQYDAWHDLALALPSIAARTTPPPDATEPAEPVDPGTRVLADPDHLTKDAIGSFNRVIDLWPDRVELTMPMAGGVSKLLIVSDFDAQANTVQLFMTDAQDLATFDFSRTFLGDCKVLMSAAETNGS